MFHMACPSWALNLTLLGLREQPCAWSAGHLQLLPAAPQGVFVLDKDLDLSFQKGTLGRWWNPLFSTSVELQWKFCFHLFGKSYNQRHFFLKETSFTDVSKSWVRAYLSMSSFIFRGIHPKPRRTSLSFAGGLPLCGMHTTALWHPSWKFRKETTGRYKALSLLSDRNQELPIALQAPEPPPCGLVQFRLPQPQAPGVCVPHTAAAAPSNFKQSWNSMEICKYLLT